MLILYVIHKDKIDISKINYTSSIIVFIYTC